MNFLFIKQKRYVILVLFSVLFLFTSCWDFLSINQPDLADPNSSFEVPITLILEPENEGGTGYFGILLPIGWTAEDSIPYSGVHSGTFIYSSAYSDSMENFDPAPLGYYWWIGESDSVDLLLEGTISFTPQIHTDNQTGTFFIDYMITDRFSAERRLSAYFRYSGPYPISVGALMTVIVTNTNDNGPGSLRQALAKVSSSGEILFNLSYPDSIVLDSHLAIDRNVTITGPDSGEVTILGNGNDTTRVFSVLANLKSVNMSNLKISHGGGGISCRSSNLSLTNVTISNNSSVWNGGGIYCWDYVKLILTNVTISNNSAGWGGGIYCAYSSALSLTDVTISNNSATRGGGGIYLSSGSTVSFVNTISWHNLPQEIYISDDGDSSNIMITHSDIQGGLQGIVTNNNGIVNWLDGNINTDPMFVDAANGDYSLQAGSPCIDAGTAFFEFGGDTLINLNSWQYNGSAPDMGAYEFGPPLGVTEEPYSPMVFTLKQNYPNPFNPSTKIKFTLPQSEFVELKVYNILGKELATLVYNKLNQGNHTYTFDGKNLASGVYYYQLVAGDFGEVKKMVLIK